MAKETYAQARRRNAFKEQGGRCHWCGCKMFLPKGNSYRDFYEAKKPLPPNACTLEHIYAKGDPRRGTLDGKRLNVAACWSCNEKRGQRGLTGRRNRALQIVQES